MWTLGRGTGEFQGVYEWDTVASAENYWTSFPMKLMKRRTVPDPSENRFAFPVSPLTKKC